MKFKGIFAILMMAFVFAGCFGGKSLPNGVDNGSKSSAEFQFKEVMRIPLDCSSCSGVGKSVTINGVRYRSDVAIRCCLSKNLIDSKVALKKVYIHRIIDQRESAQSIKFIGKNGKVSLLSPNPGLELLFYMFLKQELSSRGILLEESANSPYTYRVDFAFNKLDGIYSQNYEHLNSQLLGLLVIKNINYNRMINISTTQEARKFEASKSEDFDMFVALLVKQAANKVAEEISKL